MTNDIERFQRLSAITVATLVASTVCQPVMGAEAGRGLQLEEVIITAQRREESLQDAPISVMALGAEQLENEGISSLEDIQASAPNLQISPFPTNSSTLNMFIRGVGAAESQVSNDSPVSVYLDGVYIARNTGLALEISDLERIEVLRGPQGALYGRNAVGGALIMTTRRPSTERIEFKQKFTIGNRTNSSFTMLNMPLNDSFAVKATVLVKEDDGMVKNPTGNGDWGEKDVEGGRFDVRWHITDSLTLDYGYDQTNVNFFPNTYQLVSGPVDVTHPTITGSTTGGIYSQYRDYYLYAIDSGIGLTSDKDRLDTIPSKNVVQEGYNDIFGHTATLTWQMESAELKYIFGHREVDNASYADLSAGANIDLDTSEYVSPDGTYHPGSRFRVEQEQTSHELQLNADLNERTRLLWGAYYLEEEADEAQPYVRQHSFRFATKVPVFPYYFFTTTFAAFTETGAQMESEGWATYARLEYTPPVLNDRLHLTAGIRHSEDERQTSAFRVRDVYSYNPAPFYWNTYSTAWSETGKRDDKDDSYEWIVAFDWTDSVSTYLKYSENYVAGGFNQRDPDPTGNNSFNVGFVDGFGPEKVESYEIGVRSELLDRRARINMSVFMMDYVDRQTAFVVPGTLGDTKTINAGEASMDGVELDVSFVATEDLLLSLNYAYLDAEMEKIISPATGVDITDSYQFHSAPRNTYNVSADWRMASGDWGTASLYVNYSFMDYRNGTSIVEVPPVDSSMYSFDLVNARLTWSDISAFGGSLAASLWARNLLDEEYLIYATGTLPHAARVVMFGEERSVGLDLVYNY